MSIDSIAGCRRALQIERRANRERGWAWDNAKNNGLLWHKQRDQSLTNSDTSVTDRNSASVGPWRQRLVERATRIHNALFPDFYKDERQDSFPYLS